MTRTTEVDLPVVSQTTQECCTQRSWQVHPVVKQPVMALLILASSVAVPLHDVAQFLVSSFPVSSASPAPTLASQLHPTLPTNPKSLARALKQEPKVD